MLFALLQSGGVSWLFFSSASKAYQTYKNIKKDGLAHAIEQFPTGKGKCGGCKKIAKLKAQSDQQQKESPCLAFFGGGVDDFVKTAESPITPNLFLVATCQNGNQQADARGSPPLVPPPKILSIV